MKPRALALLLSTLALAAATLLLGIFTLAGLLEPLIEPGSAGGKESGFPLLLAIAVFFLGKWTREAWRAFVRSRSSSDDAPSSSQ